MGGGAVVAAAVAARERRIQEVVDAFRIAGATAPDRARSMMELAVPSFDEAELLLQEGIIVPGPREGTFYLSEMAFISRRRTRKSRVKILIVSAVILLVGLIV